MKYFLNIFSFLICLTLASAPIYGQFHGSEKKTYEGLALGMDFQLAKCTNKQSNANDACYITLDTTPSGEQTLHLYRVQLGANNRDILSRQEEIAVGTLNNKIVQIIILTGGLPQQDKIYNALEERLGEPNDFFKAPQNEGRKEFPYLAPGSIMSIWSTREGEISFTGEVNPEGYGVIIMRSPEILANEPYTPIE